MNCRALIIFAKLPLPGTVKTRLTPPLSAEEACGLYSAMITDTLTLCGSLAGVTPFLFFQDTPGAPDFFAALAPEICSLPQRGHDLGERMQSAFTEIFARGFSSIALIGTDSPDLPPEYIFEGFSLLEYEHTDVVFGPAEDGGYYLLAMKRVWGELFMKLPWSSEKLLAASVEAAKDACLGASFLAMWYDIDTATDLYRQELLETKSTAAHTRKFLTSILQPGSLPLSDS